MPDNCDYKCVDHKGNMERIVRLEESNNTLIAGLAKLGELDARIFKLSADLQVFMAKVEHHIDGTSRRLDILEKDLAELKNKPVKKLDAIITEILKYVAVMVVAWLLFNFVGI